MKILFTQNLKISSSSGAPRATDEEGKIKDFAGAKSSLVPHVLEGGATRFWNAWVKARKIPQQNFDQDAIGGLVWCGNMN